jgi:acyl carrier protein
VSATNRIGGGDSIECDPACVDDVVATLKRYLLEAENLHLSLADIDEHAALFEGGLGLDSVMLIELITAIESRLKFEFLEEDLRMRSFKSLRTLAQVIVERLANPGKPA